MNWILSENEFNEVIKLSGEERYEYFIKKICDWEFIWGIKNTNGWATGETDKAFFPVWPHEHYAKVCCIEEWVDCIPEKINIESWLEKWTVGLMKDKIYIAVFPTPKGKGVIVSPNRLKTDIEMELENY